MSYKLFTLCLLFVTVSQLVSIIVLIQRNAIFVIMLLLLLITLLACFVYERKDTFTILAVVRCYNNAMVFTINILVQLRYNFTALLTQ